jgi:dihydrofolate reductase
VVSAAVVCFTTNRRLSSRGTRTPARGETPDVVALIRGGGHGGVQAVHDLDGCPEHDPTVQYRRNRPRRSSMRKIKSNFFISLDGVVESPDQWHFPYFNDEMGDAVSAGFATADAMLMGRVLYDEWAAYWPEHADQPFGDVMNAMKKYVVSSSLQTAEWQNSEIISGDVAQKLTDLKAQDGGDIAMSGSATTVRWLLREGLVDELNLLVHPIAVGGGLARLFPPDEPTIPLEPLSAETFTTGVLSLSYGPVKD